MYKNIGRAIVLQTSLAMLLGSSALLAQQWVPPENPDPGVVLDGANIDIEEGRLSLAARKYLWYHENALRYRPSLAGVRLSYALNDWRELANQYPPALQDMHWVRDRAEDSLRGGSDDFSAFYDFVALNDVLGDDSRTIELFKWLDQHNRYAARHWFFIAIDALVAGSEYELCERYIVGQNSFNALIEYYEETNARFADRFEDEELDRITESFDTMLARRASFIISIFVIRDRSSEAADMAERALEVLEDETHQVQISDALEGIPPRRLR